MGELAQESRVGWPAVFEADMIHEPQLYSADRYVDRAEVEAQAYELIANREHIVAEYKTGQTYQDDARTAVFEALTAEGHLSPIQLTGSLDEIHRMMIIVLLNNYSRNVPEAERRRNFQELCSELTRQVIERRVAAGELPHETQVAEISDFIEGLSEKSAQSLGYRPLNKKGFVRSSWLFDNQDGTYTRMSEQVSRSNTAAATTESFLQAEDISVRFAPTADVRVLGTTLVHDMSEGVVGLMKRLDEHQGADIRYGAAKHSEQIPYEQLREESLRREEQAECFVERLAEFTQRLDQRLQSGELNYKQHQELLKAEIRGILQAVCTMRPAYAKDCFGEAAAQTYYEASDRAAAGDMAGAAGLIESRQHLEQAVSLCGMSISSDKAKELGVQSSELERLIRFGLENWRWTRGVCRVDECPTKPGQTEVGPCNVCRGCQTEFDRGNNPTRKYKRMKQLGRQTSWLAGGRFEPKLRPKEEFKLFDFSRFKQIKLEQDLKQKKLRRETIAV